jgi:3-oxoacyl-[acyl-carrier protein] reductase
MKAAGQGRIVTISSGAGLRASLTGIQAYAAAKHALVGLTRQLAQELGPFGITVNSVAPGFVLSNPASRAQWDSYGPDRQAAILSATHTRRLGKPEDIAGAVAFLAGPDASWITGQVLSVDGGHG